MSPTAVSSAHRPVRVWDLPTRLFHWALVLGVAGSIISAKIGGNAMVWHVRLGLAVLALLLFRVVWGVVGGYWSRFGVFVPGPARLLGYLRGAGQHALGHNPLGALSVLAMLGLLLAQVGTGLVADDEIATAGPLVAWVSSTVSSLATTWHRTGGQWLIYALVALHLSAMAFYRWRRGVDLIGPMLHGDQPGHPGAPTSADRLPQRLLALLVVAMMATLATWLGRQGG